MIVIRCMNHMKVVVYDLISKLLRDEFPLVVQELLTLPGQLGSPLVFSGVRVTQSLVLCVCFVDCCLSFFFWPLCCLSLFNLQILIAPLVSSNSSSNEYN